MLSERSAPGMEDALCDVSRKAKCIQNRQNPRVHCYLANSGEDIGRLRSLDTHSERDLQMQPSAIDVGLDFMALRRGVNSGLCKQRSYPRAAKANSNVKGKKRTCWAKSKSDLVATKSVGI